jgi:hypothetical protein
MKVLLQQLPMKKWTISWRMWSCCFTMIKFEAEWKTIIHS